jgi:hypothetical protein
MSSAHWSPSILEEGLRWVARLLAVALIGLVLVTFAGEGGFNPAELTPIEAIQLVFFLTTCLGLVLAWRWAVIGGAIATTGMLLFFVVEFAVRGRFPKGLVFDLMILSGILFVLSGLVRNRRSAG